MKITMQKGFSIVELIIIIAIITILAAVAIPMYSNYNTRTQFSTKISDLKNIKHKIINKIINNKYSLKGINISNLPNNINVNNGIITENTSNLVSGSIIKLTPIIKNNHKIIWSCNISGVTLSQVPYKCILK